MKKVINTIAVMLLATAFVACQSNDKSGKEAEESDKAEVAVKESASEFAKETPKEENKVFVKDCKFIPEKIGGQIKCLQGIRVYDGYVWSNDGKTMFMEVKKGYVQQICLLHDNGTIGSIMGIGSNPSASYDENGKKMNDEMFTKVYGSQFGEKWEAVVDELDAQTVDE